MESQKAAAGLDKVTDHVEDSSVGVDAEEELKAVCLRSSSCLCTRLNFRSSAGNGGVHSIREAEEESSHYAVCYLKIDLGRCASRAPFAAICHWPV